MELPAVLRPIAGLGVLPLVTTVVGRAGRVELFVRVGEGTEPVRSGAWVVGACECGWWEGVSVGGVRSGVWVV